MSEAGPGRRAPDVEVVVDGAGGWAATWVNGGVPAKTMAKSPSVPKASIRDSGCIAGP